MNRQRQHLVLYHGGNRDFTVARYCHRCAVGGMDRKPLDAIDPNRFDIGDVGNTKSRELLFRHVPNIECDDFGRRRRH